MEWVETTGKTLEDAKEAALDQLGVDEDDAEFEVLAEPKAGLFGRMRGEARVRARVKPARPRPKVDRRERRRRSGRRGGDSEGGDSGSEAGSTESSGSRSVAGKRGAESNRNGSGEGTGGSGAGRGGRRGTKPAERNDVASAKTDAVLSEPGSSSGSRTQDSAEVATNGAAGGGDSRNRNRRRRSSRSGESASTRPSQDTSDDQTGLDEGNGMSGDVVTIEEQVDITRSFLQGLLESFALEAEIQTVQVDDDTVEVQVQGDEKRLGLLIGPKGHTLQAIQELARTNLQRRAPGDHMGRVRIDIARYRQMRREALERFTKQVAEAVVSSGVRRVLEPMAPADRKVVHDVANELDGVRTSSEGEDPYRRVVILPTGEPPAATDVEDLSGDDATSEDE